MSRAAGWELAPRTEEPVQTSIQVDRLQPVADAVPGGKPVAMAATAMDHVALTDKILSTTVAHRVAQSRFHSRDRHFLWEPALQRSKSSVPTATLG